MSEIACDEVLRELERYLDGELEAGAATDLAEHLAECGPCSDRAGFDRRLKEIVREKCLSQAPADLWIRLRGTLEAEGRDLVLPGC